jgi:phosphoserine phosphatase RsbU/P
MRILVAEDDLTSRHILVAILERWKHEVISVEDGEKALITMKSENPPKLAILDWMMPKLDGVEVCREIRKLNSSPPEYLILLTSRRGKEDIVKGLEAGANDYISKPFSKEELKARINVGVRMIELQESLAQRVSELELALGQIKT